MTEQGEAVGPIAYFVVEFPGNKMTGEGFPLLVDLVDRGQIRVLDLLFIRRDLNGSVTALSLRDVDRDGKLDLAVFEGASSGLLDARDMAEAADAIEPGSSAGIVIYENRWALPFVESLRRGGAELVAAGFVPHEDVIAALDAMESTPTR